MSLPLTFALVSVLAFLSGALFSRWERSQVIKTLRASAIAAQAHEQLAFKAGELAGFKDGIFEGVHLERDAWCDHDDGGPEGGGEPVPVDELAGNVRPIRRDAS